MISSRLGGSMAIRDSMRASAAQYLQPGEAVQVVISATTVDPNLAGYLFGIGAILFFSRNHFRIIAVTDQRVLVLDAGRGVTRTKARGMLTELARSTRLGPASGGTLAVIRVGGERLWVQRRYFKDIQAADGDMTAA
jgi:hypothetical protein